MTSKFRTAANAVATVLSGAVVTCGVLSPMNEARAADQLLIAGGVQKDYGDRTNRNPGGAFGPVGYSVDDLCAASGVIGQSLERLISTVDQAAREAQSPITLSTIEMIPGAPRRETVRNALAETRDGVCNQPDPTMVVRPFVITYASCRMTMVTYDEANDRIENEMMINIPPGGGTVEMWMMEGGSQEVIKVELNSSLQELQGVVGRGWSDDLELVSANRSEHVLNRDTQVYTFSYNSGLGNPDLGPATGNVAMLGMGPGAMGNAVTVQSTGTLWASDSVPGIDIARSFYQNLTSTVESAQGAGFFSGIIKNTVLMLQNGLPIKMDETTSSSVMGRTSVSGRTVTEIGDIGVVDLNPGYCGLEMQIPDGYTVTDINAQISDAISQSGMTSEELAAAMQQVTPEQQAMLESMGMSDMLSGMANGNGSVSAGAAATYGAQGNAAAAATAGAAAAAGSAAPGGSNMPSSDDLQGQNLTETVQKHLEALGYDVGTANGEESLATTIAVSQFQAERGMEATGEITPQLLGVLSAEVDSRR